jgi:hypothetical protein
MSTASSILISGLQFKLRLQSITSTDRLVVDLITNDNQSIAELVKTTATQAKTSVTTSAMSKFLFNFNFSVLFVSVINFIAVMNRYNNIKNSCIRYNLKFSINPIYVLNCSFGRGAKSNYHV